MTEHRRIFLNIVATYGRSLYALVIGLFCGRWTLLSLGTVDYGLMGLVGGLIGFVAFFNYILSNATARFYAVSIGAAKVANDKDEAVEECRRWFNTALSVHVVVPVFLILVGYPIGAYAIRHWLTIPADRVIDCIWIFRFSCVSCFICMLNVPFSAMYGAKQYIAELTVYSFITTTLNACMLWYMVKHPGVWLVKFGLWTCCLSCVPQMMICIRAFYIFPECRIVPSYMWDKMRLKKVGGFSGWQMLAIFCGQLNVNGTTVVINKFFGAAMNAAQAVGTTVSAHCTTLAGAMQGAFAPVITQAYGAGDYLKMNKFVVRTCKFNVLLSLVFMLPLSLELSYVMKLWLKNPPEFSVGLCYFAMVFHLARCCTIGNAIAVDACGRLALYHSVICSVKILSLPLIVWAGFIWRNIYMVMGALVFMETLESIGRLFMSNVVVGTGVKPWIVQVFMPFIFLLPISAAIGSLPHFLMHESFLRLCVTATCCELIFLPCSWFFVLTRDERQFVVDRIVSKARDVIRG